MPTSALDAPNVNALWAQLLIESLVRHGVRVFVVGPGSRSTPLALAAHAHPRAEVVVHVDERAGAFYALGVGRGSGHPAAWITTSGTAVANGLPAAVEAERAGVPLLLLTADRPPELRETGANQTVRQPGLFAPAARWAVDLAAPTAAIDPAYVLTTAAQAVARTLGPMPGPVHLNFPFREPLAPRPDGVDIGALAAPLRPWADGTAPYTRIARPEARLSNADVARLAARLGSVERGVVVVGQADAELSASALELARTLGWPLLAGVLSQARVPEAGVVCGADLVLASPDAAAALAPEAVVVVGGRPTSKRVQTWLDASGPAVRVIAAGTWERFDPSHRATERVLGKPAAALRQIAGAVAPREPGAWVRAWAEAERRARGAADGVVESSGLSEPWVARTVAAGAPGPLVLAASMPVRDAETFGGAVQASVGGVPFVTANRGASGIDGTIATAAGVARARHLTGATGATTLLIGDLAVLHDLGSLALLRSGPPVVVVAVNNDGGGIFHFLPVAPEQGGIAPAAFEPLFGAPHGLGFRDAAAMMGLAYAAPDSREAFEQTFREAHASGASALLEVRTDRTANAALHADVLDAVGRALGV